MKTMQKIFACLCLSVLVVALFGCGSDDQDQQLTEEHLQGLDDLIQNGLGYVIDCDGIQNNVTENNLVVHRKPLATSGTITGSIDFDTGVKLTDFLTSFSYSTSSHILTLTSGSFLWDGAPYLISHSPLNSNGKGFTPPTHVWGNVNVSGTRTCVQYYDIEL
jgi:hypothetical protein